MNSDTGPAAARAELTALTQTFFETVSFAPGEMPAYAGILDLFIHDGNLINNTAELPQIWSVGEFVVARQRMVESGDLTEFEEFEIMATTDVIGQVAHRFSTYEKRGMVRGEPITGRGRISTQFVRTPGGWRMSSMAWDDGAANSQ